ncbi:hypothetical protein BT69DRAFT_1297677 [Atractiella rhizophila]|nr:hypothetical protein BT69DRAFT_1297677 [Atractiella rhizophila]
MLVKCLSLSSSSLISLSLGYLHNFSFSDSEMKALRNLKVLKHLDMYDLGAGLVLDLLDAFPSLVSLTTRNTLVGRREHVWFSERSLPQPTMRADAYPTILYRDKSKKFQADHGLKHFLPSSLRHLHLPPTSTGCIVPLLASLIRVARNTDIPLTLPPLISLTINTKEVDQGEAAVLSPLLQAIAPTIEKVKICGAGETSELVHSSLYEELRNCPKLQELELRAFHLPDWEAGKDFGPFTPSIVNLAIVECGGKGMNANLWIVSLASSLASQPLGFGRNANFASNCMRSSRLAFGVEAVQLSCHEPALEEIIICPFILAAQYVIPSRSTQSIGLEFTNRVIEITAGLNYCQPKLFEKFMRKENTISQIRTTGAHSINLIDQIKGSLTAWIITEGLNTWSTRLNALITLPPQSGSSLGQGKIKLMTVNVAIARKPGQTDRPHEIRDPAVVHNTSKSNNMKGCLRVSQQLRKFSNLKSKSFSKLGKGRLRTKQALGPNPAPSTPASEATASVRKTIVLDNSIVHWVPETRDEEAGLFIGGAHASHTASQQAPGPATSNEAATNVEKATVVVNYIGRVVEASEEEGGLLNRVVSTNWREKNHITPKIATDAVRAVART